MKSCEYQIVLNEPDNDHILIQIALIIIIYFTINHKTIYFVHLHNHTLLLSCHHVWSLHPTKCDDDDDDDVMIIVIVGFIGTIGP